MILYQPTDKLEIQQNGTRVCLLRGGTLLADMPWEAAIEVGRALIQMGRQAEQTAKIEPTIHDQAILLRAGAPLRLVQQDDELQEAVKEAQWNPQLRKYMQNGMGAIESEEQLGFPTIKFKKE